MINNLLGYFTYSKTMVKTPTNVHPLTPEPTIDTRIWLPPIEIQDAPMHPRDPRDQAQTVSAPSNDPSRSRRGTPTPSISASQAALQRLESRRRFDSPERRSDSVRKRRYTDDDQLRTTIAEKTKENTGLTQQLYSTRNDLAEAIKKNQGSQQRIQGLLEEKSAVLTQLQSAQKDWDAKERDLLRMVRELETSNRKKDDDLRSAQAKLRSFEGKQQQTTQLLEARTADLASVQTFLTTADMYSGADIIAMIESLNSEIFQTAAYMAELLEDDSMTATTQERSKNVEKSQSNLQGAVRRELGEPLWKYLEKNHADIRTDPLPLQLALQCILSRWCAYYVRYFTVGKSSDFVESLYQRIRESEAQPIAGRWRAITSAKIASSREAMSTDFIIDLLLSLLYVCGWSSAHEQSKKAMLSVQNMIFTIGKMMTQLKVATKEGITTADMEVCAVTADSVFTANMEDVYAENSIAQVAAMGITGQRVLCTVGLGLRRIATKRNESGSIERREDILLRPKVALISVLGGDSTPTER